MPVETIISESGDSDETLSDSGFYWRERDGVKVLVCRPLEEKGFINGFSTRVGGVSDFPESSLNLAGFSEDSADNIHENRRRFLNALNSEHQLATVWQAHGDDIKVVKDDADIAETDAKFDGVISLLPGVLAGVKTADCVPVLIADPLTGCFAAVHAGWRGTVRSIAAKAVAAMQREFGADPINMIAAIGPAACGRNYEVGQDVIEEFSTAFSESKKYFRPTREEHGLVDLHLANKDQLTDCRLKPENIFTSPFCTIERTDLFFSYRIAKKKLGKTGRLLSVIGRA